MLTSPDVIKGELTRQVFNVTGEVRDELEIAVDELWGIDTYHWKSIVLFDVITKIVARINSRVFVGLPLCTPFIDTLELPTS